MTRATPRHGLLVSADVQRRLRALVERVGSMRRAAALLGVGDPTISRALAGLGVRGASATALALALDQIEAEESTPTAA